ncbi:MAG: hypothetical protein IT435_08875 [Phycisphaerales bacterium]|nr:hypothetical protein [Phycisphaerales bacterium]
MTTQVPAEAATQQSSPALDAAAHPGAPVTRIVAELSGDRLCAACGFNLHGQQIVREPHYNLLMVRCPECATAAALQEYPSLGRWANRLSFIAAAIFLLGSIVALIATCAAFAAISDEFGRDDCRPLARHIATLHKAYQDSKKAAGTTAVVSNPFGAQLSGWEYDFIDMPWWNSQDRQKIIAEIPKPWLKPDKPHVLQQIAISLMGFGAGMFWAVVLSAVRRRRLWIFAISVGLGASLILYSFDGGRYNVGLTSVMAMELARGELAEAPIWFMLGQLLIAMYLGLLIGRSVARGIVRVLLQPRYRSLFGFLWTSDRLPMPRTRAG